jgi:hypothetical protein
MLIMGPRWLVPGVEGVLLVGLMITTPTRHHRQSPRLRLLVVGLVGLVTLTTLISLILLARFLLDGSHAHGHALLFAGLVLWLTNILIFGIWYWELDRGGPAQRVAENASGIRADFLFPQMSEPRLAPADWHPGFVDYLYTSYTNATAFSPTDTLPLTATAKLLMAAQSDDDRAGHVTGEHERRRPRQEARHQKQASDQLDQPDHDHEYLRRGEPIGLEGRELRRVVDEFPEPEDDEHAA